MTRDPFVIEKIRHELALRGLHKEFRSTYSKKCPEIKDLNSKQFWDKANSRTSVEEDGAMTEDKRNYIARIVNKRSGKYLGVGFGTGKLEKKLENNLEIFGIDKSPKTVHRANKVLKGKFVLGDILKIPFGNSEFNVVVASEILEHIPPSKTLTALKELKRVLKKSGLLIISVPLNEKLEEMMKKGENPNAHVRTYTIELLCAELELAGFEINTHKYFYAFENLYDIKNIIAKHVLKNRWKPNNLVISVTK